MKVKNTRRAPVLVQVYVNGSAGGLKMVTDDCDEEVFGPAFMRDSLGNDIFMSIPGEMVVVELGSPAADNTIGVRMAPVTKSWTGQGGEVYRVVVEDFRHQQQEQQKK